MKQQFGGESDRKKLSQMQPGYLLLNEVLGWLREL